MKKTSAHYDNIEEQFKIRYRINTVYSSYDSELIVVRRPIHEFSYSNGKDVFNTPYTTRRDPVTFFGINSEFLL